MTEYVIYHNPKCSKSRQALALLNQNNIEPKIIEYLKSPLTSSELLQLIKKLGCEAINLVRLKEDLFKELDPILNNQQDIVNLLVEHPSLLERPIIVKGDQVVIGRPPENVLKLIK